MNTKKSENLKVKNGQRELELCSSLDRSTDQAQQADQADG